MFASYSRCVRVLFALCLRCSALNSRCVQIVLALRLRCSALYSRCVQIVLALSLCCSHAVFAWYSRCVCDVCALYLHCVCAESAVSKIIAIDTASAVYALGWLCVGARMTLCRRSYWMYGWRRCRSIKRYSYLFYVKVKVKSFAGWKGGRSWTAA